MGEINDLVLEHSLKDLGAYYANENGFRDKVRQRLLAKLLEYEGRRIMLIAHSMGTIIAYDTLRQLGRDRPRFSVDHFITIGSPLGMPHVKRKIYLENDQVRTKHRWALEQFC